MISADPSMMSWNARGLNDATHQELVRQTTGCAQPAMICLQETKISSMTLPIALETLGHRLASYCTLDIGRTRGGILLG